MIQRKSREEMREGFKKRMQENQNKAEGGYYSPLFRKDVQIPFMSCKEGYHTIDILDYIAGKNDPHPGEPSYCYEFYYYNACGAGQGPILALGKTFGLPDPIAEDRAKKLREGYDEKSLRSISPVRNPRVLYNVICSDSREEEDKGVQVFHTSSYLMEDYLREMAKGSIRPGMAGIDPLIDFTDPVDGKSIKFKREGNQENTKFILHQFMDRPKGFVIDERDLAKVFTLDELIYIPTYEEVYIYYYGKGEAMPSARSLGGDRKEDERVAAPEEPPRRGRYEEAEKKDIPLEPERKPDLKEEAKPAASNPCPYGHVFGVDIDQFPKDCEPCESWKPCARAAKEKKATPESEASVAKSSEPERASSRQEAPAAAPSEGRSRRRRE